MTLLLSTQPPPSKSILVVDDDLEMRSALYNALSTEYRVTLAFDGLDGYEKANDETPPDLIVADVAMPRLDGVTMVRRIRLSRALRLIPVIFLTGQAVPDGLAGLTAGTFAYLPKTGNLGLLQDTVKHALFP